MICPCCDTINNDEAKKCRNCGIRLTGRRARPEDEEREKHYLKVGIAAAAIIALILTVMITLTSCICSGCVEKNAGENVINEDVGGEYFVETASYSDISGSDVSGSDISGSDAGEGGEAE